jgi:predicted glycosyltransferase
MDVLAQKPTLKVIDVLTLLGYRCFGTCQVSPKRSDCNREAAALRVPVESNFRGQIGKVDKYLAGKGRLTLIEAVEDMRSKIRQSDVLKGRMPTSVTEWP